MIDLSMYSIIHSYFSGAFYCSHYIGFYHIFNFLLSSLVVNGIYFCISSNFITHLYEGIDSYMLLFFYPILLNTVFWYFFFLNSFYFSGYIIIPSASCANRDSVHSSPPPISVQIASCCAPALVNTSSAALKNEYSEDPWLYFSREFSSISSVMLALSLYTCVGTYSNPTWTDV